MIFAGIIKTTDGKKWSVGFEALSWEDAQSIAEALGVSELGISLGTMPTDGWGDLTWRDLDEEQLNPPVPHLFAWHYRNGRIVNEDV